MMIVSKRRSVALATSLLRVFLVALVAARSRRCSAYKGRPARGKATTVSPPRTPRSVIVKEPVQADASNLSILLELRAGATDKKGKTKTKTKKATKKKKKKTKGGGVKPKVDKSQIEDALKEKDAADALGDAIRERGDQLRFETTVERSVSSIGWAMGASSSTTETFLNQADDDDEEGGGVEAAPTSVIAHYFLKSHGGAHALQCLCSLLSSLAGLGSLLFLPKSSQLSLTLLKRSMLFAMVKHVSGLLAATFLTARAIPDVGLRKARAWMEDLVTDPVSQYVFYTACILLWLPKEAVIAAPVATAAETATSTIPNPDLWWQSYVVFPIALVGPVVLRELISSMLVVCDVLVLMAFSSRAPTVRRLLQAGQASANAFMSILLTPKVWRKGSAAERQALLAKLTSKLSLALELVVGLLLVLDTTGAVGTFTFGATQRRPSFLSVLKRLLCTRLYVHFLWTRRRKISRLATSVRGGAAQLPLYAFQVLTQPRASMGLVVNEAKGSDKTGWGEMASWRDYINAGLGLDEDALR